MGVQPMGPPPWRPGAPKLVARYYQDLSEPAEAHSSATPCYAATHNGGIFRRVQILLDFVIASRRPTLQSQYQTIVCRLNFYPFELYKHILAHVRQKETLTGKLVTVREQALVVEVKLHGLVEVVRLADE